MATQPETLSTSDVPVVTIRPVSAGDAAAVHALRQQPSVIEFTLALPSERFEDAVRRLERSSSDDHVFVAEMDGLVVGMAGLHVKAGKLRHSGEIGMMVADEYQGRGIGRQLMEALLDLADNYLGLARVELEVRADNERAIRLYGGYDFEAEGRKRAAMLGSGSIYHDLLIMARLRLQLS